MLEIDKKNGPQGFRQTHKNIETTNPYGEHSQTHTQQTQGMIPQKTQNIGLTSELFPNPCICMWLQ